MTVECHQVKKRRLYWSRGGYNIQFGTEICLEIDILPESEEMHPQSAQKIMHRKLQLFCVTGSVALWSKTKI
jgi:hypothetical protein